MRLEGKVGVIVGAGQSPGEGIGQWSCNHAALCARRRQDPTDRDQFDGAGLRSRETPGILRRRSGTLVRFVTLDFTDTRLRSVASGLEKRLPR
jgi:hypothetical protein